MTLRQKEYAAAAVVIAGLVLVFLRGGSVPGLLAGLAVSLGGLALDRVWARCPACGRYLGRDRRDYCPSCGEKIDWDGKP